jgi:hypothetical protein
VVTAVLSKNTEIYNNYRHYVTKSHFLPFSCTPVEFVLAVRTEAVSLLWWAFSRVAFIC